MTQQYIQNRSRALRHVVCGVALSVTTVLAGTGLLSAVPRLPSPQTLHTLAAAASVSIRHAGQTLAFTPVPIPLPRTSQALSRGLDFTPVPIPLPRVN